MPDFVNLTLWRSEKNESVTLLIPLKVLITYLKNFVLCQNNYKGKVNNQIIWFAI